MQHAVVVGGTRGLGRAIARQLDNAGFQVSVTGTTYARPMGLDDSFFYQSLRIGASLPELECKVKVLVNALSEIDVLVYSPGLSQVSQITDLSVYQIGRVLNINQLGLIALAKEILRSQDNLPTLVYIGSTSQTIPRATEIPYCSGKAGGAMAAWALGKTEEVGRSLVVEVAGMQTDMQRDPSRGLSKEAFQELLDPKLVASEVCKRIASGTPPAHVRILRPFKVEEVQHFWE